MLGGVVGELRRSTLLNCTFRGNAECGAVAGGIVGRSDESLIAGCESDATVTASQIAGGIVGQLWRSDLLYSEFSGKISFPTNAGMNVSDTGYFGGIAGDAGLDYEIYLSMLTLEGGTRESTIDSCRFTGDITMDSMQGMLPTATAGGICARAFDCSITNAEVCKSEIAGRSAYAITAYVSPYGNPTAAFAAVSDTVLDGVVSSGITATQENSCIYADTGIAAEDGTYTPVADWASDAPELSGFYWISGSGRPTLAYAGLLPEDILETLRGASVYV